VQGLVGTCNAGLDGRWVDMANSHISGLVQQISSRYVGFTQNVDGSEIPNNHLECIKPCKIMG